MFISQKQIKDFIFNFLMWNLGAFIAIALLDPLFIKEDEVFDSVDRRVGSIVEVSTPQVLQQLQPADEQAENIVIDLLDWQVCQFSYLFYTGYRVVWGDLLWIGITSGQVKSLMCHFKKLWKHSSCKHVQNRLDFETMRLEIMILDDVLRSVYDENIAALGLGFL